MFTYVIYHDADQTKIAFEGDMDIDATEVMEEEITPALLGFNRLVFDFSNVHFVDSSGIGLLISLVKTLKEQGALVEITRLNPDVKRVFELLQLPEILGTGVLQDFVGHADISS